MQYFKLEDTIAKTKQNVAADSVLIIGKSKGSYFLLESVLKKHNFSSEVVSTAEEALEKVLKKHFFLLLIDPDLEQMNGFELAEVLQKNEVTANIPTVFVSVKPLPKKKILKAFRIGAVDCIDASQDQDQDLFSHRLVSILNTQKKCAQLEQYKSMLEASNNSLEKIAEGLTKSISYARRIQDGILPENQKLTGIFPKSFVFFQPKEILSGDFYWMATVNNQTVIALVDCIGHGVPGALMSMIGNNFLNQIVIENQITRPEVILNYLHEGMRSTFKENKEGKSSGFKEGMDVAICNLDHKTNTLSFSGARRPLYFYSNGELKTIKGNRYSISDNIPKGEGFECHKIEIKKNNAIYLTTDGFIDQFGGKLTKKFTSKRLKNLLESIQLLSMDEQEKFIQETFYNWKKDNFQVDDITLIGIRF